jgi:hypothetical protein
MIREVIYLPSRKKIFKEGCGSCPTFRVSSCPLGPQGPQGIPGIQGEPGTSITPVYGSLYTENFVLATSNTNVDFDAVGLSSGTTLDITDDPITGNSITVNSPGVYTISFSTVIITIDHLQRFPSVIFSLSINGTPDITKDIRFQTITTNVNQVTTISRTDQLMLNQGDVIQVFISLSNDSIDYRNAALVVTKVA